LMRYGYSRQAALEVGFEEASRLLDRFFGR
jgi:hypothetical protein